MRVSVLVNNYNYAQFLPYCIESVLDQTEAADEIILYDDGSSDDSLSRIEKYSSHLIIIANSNFNSSPSFNQANAINQAFSQSTSDIICLLDSDDAFLPNKIKSIKNEFHTNPHSIVVQHPFHEIDDLNKRTGNTRPRLKDVNPLDYIAQTNNLLGLFSQTSGLCFRRSYLNIALPILPDRFEKVWPDVRLTRQSPWHGQITTLKDPLGEYRVHDNNDSDKLKQKDYYQSLLVQMYAFYNESAARSGNPKISLEKSIHKLGQHRLEKFQHTLMSPEPMSEKWIYIQHLFAGAFSRFLKP